MCASECICCRHLTTFPCARPALGRAHAAPQKSARLDDPGANGITMRKKHESAGEVLNMPQAARSLTPEMRHRASAFAENSIPCSVRNVNYEFGQISHFQKPQMACPPCLDFPHSCDILFLAGAFSALSRVLSVRCRAVARGRLLFLRHIKTARADLRAGGCSVLKKPRRVCRQQAAKKVKSFSLATCA